MSFRVAGEEREREKERYKEKAEEERKIVGLSSSVGEAGRRQPLKIVLF